MDVRQPVRRLVKPPLLLLAFLWVVLEETLWRWAQAIGGLIARIPLLAALERLVPRLDARVVAMLFVIPLAALLPLKIAAVWLIGSGNVPAGIALLLAAKTLGTAFSARLYVVAEPRLLEIRAFAWAHGRVRALLARAHAFLDASPTWQAARRAMQRGRAMLRGLAARARAMLGGTLLGRVRAVRAEWRRRG